MDRVRSIWQALQVRRALVFLACLSAGASPLLACEEQFTGGGGLPGDFPRQPTGDGAASDAVAERADAPTATDAPADTPSDSRDARD